MPSAADGRVPVRYSPAVPGGAVTGAKGEPTPDYTEFETFRLVRPRSSEGTGGRFGLVSWDGMELVSGSG